MNLGTYFFEAKGKPIATCDINIWWEKVKGTATEKTTKANIDLENRIMKLNMVMDNDGEMTQSEYYARRYLSFFASLLSGDYNLIHAGGLQVNDKGIMIVGKSKSGKSTLVSDFLPDAKVIDDDMIMTDWETMYRTCKWGQSYKSPIHKNHMTLHDNFYSCPLNFIVLLTHEIGAREIRDSSPEKIREVAFDNRLPEELRPLYLDHLSLPSNVPIYEVGTRGPDTVTKDTIMHLVE